MRAFLQFVGCAGSSLCALIVAGSFLIGTPAGASTAPELPPAKDCTVCNCSLAQPTCSSATNSGCSTLCTFCRWHLLGGWKCETP